MTTTAQETAAAPPRGLAQPILAGVLMALVGYASTFTLVLSGLAHVGASPAQAASGLFSTCLALGLLNVVVVWRLRIPLSFAWSTPGAAFLLTLSPPEGGFPAVTGAFLVVAALVLAAGLIRPLARAVAAIPGPIAGAMLAGVLLNLCLAPLKAVADLPWLTLPILVAWAIGLKFARRYAVPLAVVTAAILLAVSANLPAGALSVSLPSLDFVTPTLTLDAIVRVALPLFVITMASQNLTGLAVMRANGFEVHAGPPFVVTGIMSAIIAIFGGLTVNLAAITAALGAGPEAHPDPAQRWVAPFSSGFAYLALALLATLAAAFIAASPPILIEAVAGLALLPSLASALAGSLAAEETRLPAIVTFVTTASGITLLGIGGAFWGLLAGIGLTLLLRALAAGMTPIAAVILAGGRGERLGGVNKALIEIGGRRLIDRAAEAIAGCDPILIAVGRRPFATAGLRQIIDLPGDYAGPLAGVAAAVEALRNDPPKLLLSLAVDTPFFPHDFLRRATSALIGASAVVGAFGAQDYPTNALWRFDAIRTLPTEVRAGIAPRSLKRLAAALSAARLDYLGVSADDPFANVNTPEELAILRGRIA